MKFLANENVAGDAIIALREKGHDVAWIRTDAPGSKDEDVLARNLIGSRLECCCLAGIYCYYTGVQVK